MYLKVISKVIVHPISSLRRINPSLSVPSSLPLSLSLFCYSWYTLYLSFSFYSVCISLSGERERVCVHTHVWVLYSIFGGAAPQLLFT